MDRVILCAMCIQASSKGQDTVGVKETTSKLRKRAMKHEMAESLRADRQSNALGKFASRQVKREKLRKETQAVTRNGR